MNYNELLNNLIKESGKMAKDIVAECERNGIKLTTAYLSSLRNSPERTASDEISIAIAKACGAKYDEILVVQAYLDKAPEIMIEYLESSQKIINYSANFFTMLAPDHENEEINKILSEFDRLKQQPLAELICEFIYDQRKTDYDNILNKMQPEAEKAKEAKWMVISPNQMKDIKLINESDIKKILDIEKKE